MRMASTAGWPHCVLWAIRLSVMNTVLPALGGTQSAVEGHWNMTSTMEQLLHGYDRRTRPNVTGAAVRIGVVIDLIGIDNISELDMKYTVTYDIRQSWVDERLDFRRLYDGKKMTFLGEDTLRIWRPDTFIKNGQGSRFHDVTKDQQTMHVFRDGRVLYKLRLTTIASCWMKMHLFPFDTQNCTLLFETYGYTTSDVVYYWYRGRQSVRGFEKVRLADFMIENFDFLATTSKYSTGIMTVVTITNIVAKVQSTLPRVSYIKAIDVYLGVCLVYVFGAVAEYAAVNHNYYTRALMRRRWEMQAARKRRSRAGVHKFSEESSGEMEEKYSSNEDNTEGSDDVIDLTRTGRAKRWARGREDWDREISGERIEGRKKQTNVPNLNHGCSIECCTDTETSFGIENLSDEITRRAPHRYSFEIETLRTRSRRMRHRSSYHGCPDVGSDVSYVMTEIGQRMSKDTSDVSLNQQGNLTRQETTFYSWPHHKRQWQRRQEASRHSSNWNVTRSTNIRVNVEASSSEEDSPRKSKDTEGRRLFNTWMPLSRITGKLVRDKNVNRIDKIARIFFPLSFLLFNIMYLVVLYV
ncbi:uncharacterized protein LOC144926596 isoform X2 [Branchiostoma floridae x Branchiostoma belcheri]